MKQEKNFQKQTQQLPRHSEFKTISGIVPDNVDPRFTIATSRAEEWIQKKLNLVVEQLRKNGKEVQPIEIQVISVPIRKSTFLPMLVLLPESAEFKRNKIVNQQSELEIFDLDDSEGRSVRIHNWILSVLEPYMFTKANERDFFSQSFRQQHHTTINDAHDLKAMRRPSYFKTQDKKSKFITVMIDPSRVFKDMVFYANVDFNNPINKFEIVIDEMTKLNQYNYNYSFYRFSKKSGKIKGNGNVKDSIITSLNRRFQRG